MKNFIIATGRCGSTLLSRCMAKHPDTLVLFEFWPAMDHLTRFNKGNVTARELARILSGDVSLAHLWLSRGFTTVEVYGEIESSEILKPRWRMPGLLMGALALLAEEPAVVFKELIDWASQQPTQPLDKHYAAVFRWLMDKFGKTHCIERSAGSTDHVADLLRCFPEARFVHIHRDGPEAALSMYNHTYFDLAVSVTYDPPSREELKTMANSTASADDRVVHRVKHRAPIEAFGAYWAASIARLYRDIRKIPPNRFLDVRHEDLVADPAGVLTSIQGFFDLPPNKEWIPEASALVKPVPSYVDKLSVEERKKLEAACYLGQILLGRDPRGDKTPVLEVEAVLRELYDQPLPGSI